MNPLRKVDSLCPGAGLVLASAIVAAHKPDEVFAGLRAISAHSGRSEYRGNREASYHATSFLVGSLFTDYVSDWEVVDLSGLQEVAEAYLAEVSNG